MFSPHVSDQFSSAATAFDLASSTRFLGQSIDPSIEQRSLNYFCHFNSIHLGELALTDDVHAIGITHTAAAILGLVVGSNLPSRPHLPSVGRTPHVGELPAIRAPAHRSRAPAHGRRSCAMCDRRTDGRSSQEAWLGLLCFLAPFPSFFL